jgi:hypothetical protein
MGMIAGNRTNGDTMTFLLTSADCGLQRHAKGVSTTENGAPADMSGTPEDSDIVF